MSVGKYKSLGKTVLSKRTSAWLLGTPVSTPRHQSSTSLLSEFRNYKVKIQKKKALSIFKTVFDKSWKRVYLNRANCPCFPSSILYCITEWKTVSQKNKTQNYVDAETLIHPLKIFSNCVLVAFDTISLISYGCCSFIMQMVLLKYSFYKGARENTPHWVPFFRFPKWLYFSQNARPWKTDYDCKNWKMNME